MAALCDGPIDADFVRSGHVVLASAPGHAAGFADAGRRSCRPSTCRPTPSPARTLHEEIGSDAFFGGLVVERSGGLHPGKLTAGLVTLAEAAGATLHEDVRALHVRRQADGRSVVETIARRDPRQGRDRRDERVHRAA